MINKITPMIDTAIVDYSRDPENPELNFNLAHLYDKMNQTAAAISFYLRTAERTDNKLKAYECLLKIGNAFDRQKNRNNTVRCMYKQAICLLPKRPEAYYLLSKNYEFHKEYIDSYTIAEIALNVCDFFSPHLDDVGYVGQYGIIFEKAVSAWWWGKSAEARSLFKSLAKTYVHQLDEAHYNAVEKNLSSLGSGPESQAFRIYNKKEAHKLRFKFKGYERIDFNHSQVYQDMFVLSMLDGKTNGTYLEIGSADPYYGNNTALLEKLFDWTGVGIEYDQKFIQKYQQNRKNPVLCVNALETDYDSLLSKIADENNCVDYLQLDCEPPKVTYEIMQKIPFDKYKFAVITFEHDDYIDMTNSFKTKSREFLHSKGYVLVVNDVSPDGESNFEDWWVHPDLVSPNILAVMTKTDQSTKKIDTDYFLTDKYSL